MSFLSRLFGGSSTPPDALTLDLARLKKAAKALNEPRPKGQSNQERLHDINHRLGDRLTRCAPADRVVVANAIAQADSALPPDVRKAGALAETAEARSVRDTGCADLGRSMSPTQIADIMAHLKSKPVLLAHDAHMATARVPSLADVPPDQNYACYDYLDLWSSPHIMELATSDRIIDVAQGYFGCTPTMYSINAFWSFPNRTPHPYSQVFHRDWEDYRSLVAFTLLTSVDSPEEGAHYYVEASHEVAKFMKELNERGVTADVGRLSERGQEIAPLAMKLFEHSARRFDGPAGQSFCIDGYGLHRACVPQSRPRLLLWMRFGQFFNEVAYKLPKLTGDRATAQAVLRRIPDTPRHRYIFRYLIRALSAV